MKSTSNPNHSAHILELSGVAKHPNADRLQIARAFGSNIIVGLDAKDGDIGVYFQSGLAVDAKFAIANDLIRRKNLKTGAQEGGMLEANGRIKSQRLRGEMSDGLFISLESLKLAGISKKVVDSLQPGDFFDTLDGIPVCTKYTPKTRDSRGGIGGSAKSKKKSVMFLEHYDTAQLRFNFHAVSSEDSIVVTEKVHGTSQRVGNVREPITLKGFKAFIAKLFKLGPITTWEDLIGTRRTVVKTDGFYSKNFRVEASKDFLGKLHKGETIYYEVVGYSDAKPIMGTTSNEKVSKDFVKQYGKHTVFSYGCEPGEFAIYVYRITLTNEDGHSVDYPWDDVVNRCEQLGVKHVPVIFRGSAKTFAMAMDSDDFGEMLTKSADAAAKGSSIIDPSHVKEGIVLRIEGSLKPKAYKHKSFEFKVLEGIIKPESAAEVGAEEEM